MEDVILINPNQHNFERLYKKFRFSGFKFPLVEPVLPHLGLCSLASVLQECGYRVRVVDGHLFFLENEQILKLLVENQPKLLGITVNSPALFEIYLLIRKIREAQQSGYLPENLKIIVGGPHITAMPKSISEIGADFGCLGEAEETLPLLCDYLIKGKGAITQVNGLVCCGEKQQMNAAPQLIEDLDALPPPAFDLYLVPEGFQQKLLTIPFVQSRGCVYNCIFCVSSYLSKRKIRFESISKIIEKMNFLIKRNNPKFINFIDNVFTYDKERIKELTIQIRKNNINIDWSCQTRANFIDDNLLREMSLAGCKWISFGIESGDNGIRRSIGKGIDNKRYFEVFDACRKNKIKTSAFFMVGFPSETKEDLKETEKLAIKLRADYLILQSTVVYPGTKLFYDSINNGNLDKKVWSEYTHGRIGLPFYIPKGLSIKELRRVRLRAYVKHYVSFRFISQVLFNADVRYWLKNWLKFKYIYRFRKYFSVFIKIFGSYKKY